jgi:CheY-like chemotaxis protein
MVLHDVGKPMFEGEILLCEDNAMNQQVICEHLARVGLKTVVAENGKIVVDTVQSRMLNGEKQFDLIFMDIHMPVMDGLDASVKIKELNTGVPIVAMTANIMTSDMEIYKTNGMDGCVGKPFTSQELWRCLLKYLEPVSLGETHADAPKSGLIDENDHIKTELEFKKSIQLSFVKNNQDTYEKIVQALEKGDIELAHRMAHTLKSNAGHIGKYVLQNAAAKVEEQLKEGKNLAASHQMDMLKAELEEALAELAPLLEEAEQEAAPQVEPLDAERARELLENLEPLLRKGSPDCMNFIDSLRSIPGSEKLINQIDDFDFEAALLSLGELKEN